MLDKYIKKENNYYVLENVTFRFGECDCGKECSAVISTDTTEIEIPDYINIIGNSAFEKCEKIKIIVIPENVCFINCCAFYNCTQLEKIVIKNPETIISSKAFTNCNNLTIYAMPNSLVNEYAIKNGFAFKDIGLYE